MVSINLLKGQQRDARLVRRRAVAELCTGIVALVGVCASWGWVAIDGNRAAQRFERDIRAKQERVALLERTHQQVLELEERLESLVAEDTTLKALMSESDAPLRLLSTISRVIDPLDVWLRHLQVKDATVTLIGFARSLEDVLTLARDFERIGPVDVLEAEPDVNQPDLLQFSMNVFMDS